MVNSVSCGSQGNCAAGGTDDTFNTGDGSVLGHAFVMDETDGSWGSAEQVPGMAWLNAGDDASVGSVSCAAAGDCTAGGYYDAGQAGSPTRDLQAFVVDETGGTWGTAQEVPGMSAINTDGALTAVASVSCVSATDCAASGSYGYTGANWPNDDAFVVDKSVHESTATSVTASAAKVTYGDERAERFSVKVTAGSAGTPTGTVFIASGSTTACTITLASGTGSCTPAPTRLPAGPVSVTASYRGSFVFGASASAVAGFTVVKAATKTGLKLSAAKVTYGHEQAEKLSVAVSAKPLPSPSKASSPRPAAQLRRALADSSR